MTIWKIELKILAPLSGCLLLGVSLAELEIQCTIQVIFSALSTSVSEKSPRSPQLSDFGLERYIVSQVLPNPPQAVNNQKEEPKILTPFSKHSLVKTPKCALKMDDFECVTPKLEHFGISEYTMCLNDDYTIGLKNVKTNR